VLDAVLGRLARQHDPNVLVGFDKADDAGVYRLSGELALVQTVDFFTPVVDDPYTFGQIAAVNSLSDVYAMGGKPLSALAMVCFPEKADPEILERILAGGLSKMVEAGCTVVGGHSVRDEEIKFGYAVTGTIHPDRVLTNAGAKVGDVLVFTKALGTGVISTAIKKGQAKQEWIDAATQSMTMLNKIAAEVITQDKFRGAIHAATDVTGFGMIGHAREMALASGVSLKIDSAKIAALPGALDCIRAGFIPGGLKSNEEFAQGCVEFAAGVAPEIRTLLFDPQTAGGLLVSIDASRANETAEELKKHSVAAILVGSVVAKTNPLISVG
jgi:selenide,water dikinase